MSNIPGVRTMPRKDPASEPVPRALPMLRAVLSTFLTAALAAGLVLGGTSLIASRAATRAEPEAAPPITVATQPLVRSEGYTITRGFVGQVEPRQQTALGFETAGALAAVLVDEGNRVARGDVIARLDTRSLMAERAARVAARDALVAQLELAELTTRRQSALEDRGFAATQRLDEARLRAAELRARIAEADATLDGIDIALDKAVMHAPFDGEIGARSADEGKPLGVGSPVVTLLETEAPQMRVGLPPALAAGLSPGMRVVAEIGGDAYDAVLTQIRPDLDPVTRTQGALFTLETDTGQAPTFGQTGRIRLEQTVAESGAWVPLGALRAGPNGSWTILILAADNRVAAEAVELLHADGTRAFVRGGFDNGARLIAAGPHRLTPGQKARSAE